MESNSRGKDGEGTSGVKRVEDDDNYDYDDDEEQEMKFLPLLLHSNVNTNGFADPLVQLPLQHGYEEPPPPLVMPQVPAVAAMQRPRVVAQPQPAGAFMQNGYVECVFHQRLKSVKIRWNHAGTNVAIAGTWDNWETTEPLQNVGQYFVIVKTLPIGIYHYRFIVDGYLTHAPDFPSAPPDDSGYAYNILDLQDSSDNQGFTTVSNNEFFIVYWIYLPFSFRWYLSFFFFKHFISFSFDDGNGSLVWAVGGYVIKTLAFETFDSLGFVFYRNEFGKRLVAGYWLIGRCFAGVKWLVCWREVFISGSFG